MPLGKIITYGNKTYINNIDNNIDWVSTGKEYTDIQNAISVKSAVKTYTIKNEKINTTITNYQTDVDKNIGTLTFDPLCIFMFVYIDLQASAVATLTNGTDYNITLYTSMFKKASTDSFQLLNVSNQSQSGTFNNSTTAYMRYWNYDYSGQLSSYDTGSNLFDRKDIITSPNTPLVGFNLASSVNKKTGLSVSVTINGTITVRYIYIA